MYVCCATTLQKLGQEKGVSLHTCLLTLDLQKAYDSIDRGLPWAVLARFHMYQPK